MKRFLPLLLSVLLGNNLVHAVSLPSGHRIPPSVANEQPARLLSGVVTDATNHEPLPGVSVVVKGTAKGTTTNAEGHFSLNISDTEDNAMLSFSFIGFEPQEVAVDKNQTTINVALKETHKALNEVVVVGYGTQKKINLTGAVDQVTSEVLENRPIVNTGRGLQGVIPNLNISFSSGQPGSSPTFNIRGITSLNGGSPLILVDGVPGDINSINPSDINKVSVLKDAASAAIYGARGAYGVILIETKSGASGKMRINYGTNIGFNTPTRLPKAVTDTYTSMKIYNDAYKAYSGQDFYSQADLDYAQQRSADPSLPAVVVAPTTSGSTYKYFGNTDWYKEMYRKRQSQSQHNLSLAGGTDRFDYYVSGGFLNQNGIYQYNADKYRRYNFRSKVNAKLNKWLTFSNATTYNYGNYDYPTFYGNSTDIQRYVAVLGQAQSVPKNPDGSWTGSGYPIAALLDGGRGATANKYLQNILGFRMSFLDNNLEINGNYTYQNDGIVLRDQYKKLTYSTAPGIFSQTGINRATNQTSDNYYHIYNLFTSYQRQMGKHYARALVGYNQELRTFSGYTASRNDLISDQLSTPNLGTGDMIVTGNASQWAIRGAFYRLNYNYDERYLLELNGRYDGTSRFPKTDRFGFFPSVSAGWRISEEKFFSKVRPVISQLKFRGSYGSLGNQFLDPNVSATGTVYPYVPVMSTSQSGVIIDGKLPQTINVPGLVSNSLTWEVAQTTDFGVDATLLKGRLDLTYDWYSRSTSNILTKSRTLPAVLGTSEPQTNAASLRTRGWEASVKWHDNFQLAGKTFDYDLGAVLSDYHAVITKYDNPTGYLGDNYVGKQFGEIWGFETEGFFQSADELKSHADQSAVVRFPGTQAVGDLKFRDLNGDGKVDMGDNTVSKPGDRRIIGNTTPRYQYGFNGRASWNNFSISAFFQGIGKRDYYPGAEASYFWSVYNRPYNTPLQQIVNNTWTPENPDAYFPRLKGYIALGNGKELSAPQTRYLQNAAYLRWKNLTVGYTIPAKLTQRLGIERVQFYISGENIWETTKLKMPIDPELINASNPLGDGQSYPFQRTYAAGLNITF
jgi:TonB-linked SusC/RagA family outer membrane protein